MLSTAIIIALCAVACASPLSSNLAVHEKLDFVPEGFSTNGPAAGGSSLSLRFALVPSNIQGLEKVLYEISTPGNEKYGNHLTQDEIAAFVKPTPASVSLVNDWLSSNNLISTPVSFSGDMLQVSIPVSKANELLGTNFQVFTEQASGKQAIRALSYSIPVALKGHLEHIHPTVNFPIPTIPAPLATPAPSTSSSNSTSSCLRASCDTVTTPACIQELYGVPITPATQSVNRLFVSGFAGQYANKNDLAAFLQANRQDLPPSTSFSLVSVNGGTNPQSTNETSGEANLDIQYTIGVASGVPISYISVGPADIESNEEFFTALENEANYLLTMDDPPTVLTSTYGLNENSITGSLATTLCNLYMQLGARGISVLLASGDGGVAGGHPIPCANTTFLPTFPGTCPYVTSVGATQLEQGSATEKGADLGYGSYTSGGFSNYFRTPAYQFAQVSTYVEGLGSTYAGRYNTTGRGFPDVSALGVNYTVLVGGESVLMNGTSASAPTFAAIVALLNDRLITAGKSPLGFLNPLLYSTQGSAALKDITAGKNPGCGTEGFSAGAGWDPVTGLGTPIFSQLLTVIAVES